MHREYHRWYSPSLHRDMELLVFGHAEARVLVFPTSKGRFHEWEDRGMMHALGHHIAQGWLQLYCVDSVDAESWYAYHLHPGARAWRQEQYDRYLCNEVLPLSRQKNSNPFLITTGASIGARIMQSISPSVIPIRLAGCWAYAASTTSADSRTASITTPCISITRSISSAASATPGGSTNFGDSTSF